MEAATKGYTQVLWLFGEENYVTEVGTMNIFFFLKKPDGMWARVCMCALSTLVQAARSFSLRRWMEQSFRV